MSNLNDLNATERQFHDASKPEWTADGTIVYTISETAPPAHSDSILRTETSILSQHTRTRLAKFAKPADALTRTLHLQKELTEIEMVDEVSTASLRKKKDQWTFSDFARRVSTNTPAGLHEHLVWTLASVLFDDVVADKPEAIPSDKFEQYEARIRKDKLSEFWESVVQHDAQEQSAKAKSAEEKALVYLSAHNVVGACGVLAEGMDLRLATMIAQIDGSDMRMRAQVAKQIDDWRRLNMLSEMSEPIRALYELLAGNCQKSTGNEANAAAEDRASTFNISSRFGLDWRRAFGLRLWYSTVAEEPLELAVGQYADELRDGLEDVRPIPWWREQKSVLNVKGAEDDSEAHEDLLWGLLKLYAAQTLEPGSISANIEAILSPLSVTGNPLNGRLCWQLLTLFRARSDQIRLDTNRFLATPRTSLASSTATQNDAFNQSSHPLVELSDALTLTFALPLQTPNQFPTAIWIYTHLSNSTLRRHSIQSLLNRFAANFPVPMLAPQLASMSSDLEYSDDTNDIALQDPTFKTLFKELRIPHTWLHAAHALRAHAILNDPVAQIRHLVLASSWPDAHSVLVLSVAPRAVVERTPAEVRTTKDLLAKFEGDGEDESNARRQIGAKQWREGGQVYRDYYWLLSHDVDRQALSFGTSKGKEKRKHNITKDDGWEPTLMRLAKGLETLGNLWAIDLHKEKSTSSHSRLSAQPEVPFGPVSQDRATVMRRAALSEMSNAVVDWLSSVPSKPPSSSSAGSRKGRAVPGSMSTGLLTVENAAVARKLPLVDDTYVRIATGAARGSWNKTVEGGR